MKISIKSISPAILASLIAAPIGHSYATVDLVSSKLAVKTSIAEVNGVREIESGDYQRGIVKSEAALAKAKTASLRKPLLDNLCVAHLAINMMDKAQSYCNEAVNTGSASSISYNNRAVMHYMLGNFEASLEDLEIANELGSLAKMVNANMSVVSKKSMLSKN